MGYFPRKFSAAFYGVHLTRLSNLVIDNEDPFPFGVANEDSGEFWDIGDPTKIVIPPGQGGWYWVGADITTLGTNYGGSSNANVTIAVLKNWDGVSTQLGFYCAAERFENGNSTLAYMNTLSPQLVELAAGDVLQLVLIGGGSDLLVESNPSDGAPSGYLADDGPGTLSPHFYVLRAGPGLPGPQGVQGEAGSDGVVQTIVEGTNVTVDDSDPANPIISVDSGFSTVKSASATLTQHIPNNLSYEQWGTEEAVVAQADAPSPCAVVATVSGEINESALASPAVTDRGLVKLQISFNGGSSFADITGTEVLLGVGGSTSSGRGNGFAITGRATGTVTGDIQVRAMVADFSGANDCVFDHGNITILVHD